jgi:Cysteine rich repeat
MTVKLILLVGVFVGTQFDIAHAESNASQPSGATSGLPPEAKNPAIIAARLACNAEIDTFCSSIRPGGGRIVRCLVEHKNELSQNCIDGMRKAKAALGR